MAAESTQDQQPHGHGQLSIKIVDGNQRTPDMIKLKPRPSVTTSIEMAESKPLTRDSHLQAVAENQASAAAAAAELVPLLLQVIKSQDEFGRVAKRMEARLAALEKGMQDMRASRPGTVGGEGNPASPFSQKSEDDTAMDRVLRDVSMAAADSNPSIHGERGEEPQQRVGH